MNKLECFTKTGIIKIALCDWYNGFDLEHHYSQLYHIFTHNGEYKLEFVKSGEEPHHITFYSMFGNKNTQPKILCPWLNRSKHGRKYPIRIEYIGENKRPKPELCDLSISFDYINGVENHYRFPLYLFYGYPIFQKKKEEIDPLFFKKKGFCCFLVSNGEGYNIFGVDTFDGTKKRNDFFHLLNSKKKVDSGGAFENNISFIVPKDETVEWISKYKFCICFENSEHDGYTTEKLAQTYSAGTVGIYWGNPLIHLDFNTNAFINCYEFGCDWEKICDYILYLDGNNELYKYVLAQPLWIRDEIPENLRFDRLKERISAVL